MTDLDELERLLREATAGPWRQTDWGNQIVSGTGQNEILVATIATNTYRDQGRHTGDLIPALRNCAEELIRDARRWREIERRMTHQQRANAVGWTLDALLPGNDPGEAVDAIAQEGKK